MPKYALSLLVKPKLKNLLSVLHYKLPSFRGKGQNQHVATFWCHKSIEINRLNCKLFSICGPCRTRLDNVTKIQSSNAWISSRNAQMLRFLLCREKVTGMPRIEIKSLNSIWSSVLAYVWLWILFFSTPINLQHIARPVESDRSIIIMSVCLSVLP